MGISSNWFEVLLKYYSLKYSMKMVIISYFGINITTVQSECKLLHTRNSHENYCHNRPLFFRSGKHFVQTAITFVNGSEYFHSGVYRIHKQHQSKEIKK